MAASGGYIAALGADRIIALGNALVGSVGVLVQYPNFAKLLDTVGVKIEDVKSSPLKASPSGYEPTSPEARAALATGDLATAGTHGDVRARYRHVRTLHVAVVDVVAQRNIEVRAKRPHVAHRGESGHQRAPRVFHAVELLLPGRSFEWGRRIG